MSNPSADYQMIPLHYEQENPNSTTQSSKENSYRPRIIYASTFIWLTVVGGRFLAPFLEHEAQLTSGQIGFALAGQQIAIALVTSVGGVWADALERNPEYRGKGRVWVICVGVTGSTVCFGLHGVQHLVGSSRSHPFFGGVVWHTLLQIVYGAFVSLIFPVLDGLTIDYLENSNSNTDEQMNRDSHSHSDRRSYGKERLHGPVWWAVANLLLSPLLDRWGFVVCYPLGLVALVGVWASLILFTSGSCRTQSTTATTATNTNVQFQRIQEEDETSGTFSDTRIEPILTPSNQHERLSITQAASQLLHTSTSNGRYIGAAFLLCLLCISSGQAVVDNLMFLFLEHLGSSYLLLGVSVVVKIVFEVPVFYYGDVLLRTYGHFSILLLGCGAYILRVVLYSFLPFDHATYVLLLEPLHGLTYGSVQVALVEFAATCLPRGNEAVGQSLLYFVREAGSVMGVWVGGWADGAFGPRMMFRASAVVVLMGSVVLGMFLFCKAPPKTQHSHPTKSQNAAETFSSCMI